MKRGILIIVLIVLMSSLVSAGLFSGVWQNYLTGRQIGEQSSGELIYSIGPSVPVYSLPFNVVVVTNKPAICQYTFRSENYQNPPYASFTNNGGTDHIQTIPAIYDGDTKVIFRCKEPGLFKPWEYAQTSFIISTKGGCCIVRNNCNTYKSLDECTSLGGALYPDPNCNYVDCKADVSEVKKPDLIIENVDLVNIEDRSRKLPRGEGFESMKIYKYKLLLKNIGNTPVNDNFYICGKVVGMDYCTKLTQVQQRGVEYTYEKGDNFVSRLVRRVRPVTSQREVLDPINVGQTKEVVIGSSEKIKSFIVDIDVPRKGGVREAACLKGVLVGPQKTRTEGTILVSVDKMQYSILSGETLSSSVDGIKEQTLSGLTIKNNGIILELNNDKTDLIRSVELMINGESYMLSRGSEVIVNGKEIRVDTIAVNINTIYKQECIEWAGGKERINYNNLIDELNEDNNEYILS